jgi:hypothetical protein
MDQFIVRAKGDGTDFIGTPLYRHIDQPAGRSGMGDMICEMSNLIAQSNRATILADKAHNALNTFCKMANGGNYIWDINPVKFRNIARQSKDWHDFQVKANRRVLHCYPDFPYIRLNEEKFIKTDIPIGEYATIQRVPFAKKCGYTDSMIQSIVDRYPGMKIIDVGGKESLGLEKLAYIINNAKFHIGIDSGMSHFAHCIKDKKDVHLYVPKDKITGVTYRWINQGFNVELI